MKIALWVLLAAFAAAAPGSLSTATTWHAGGGGQWSGAGTSHTGRFVGEMPTFSAEGEIIGLAVYCEPDENTCCWEVAVDGSSITTGGQGKSQSKSGDVIEYRFKVIPR